MRKSICVFSALALGITISASASAVVPELIPLQGILTDDLGDPIDGSVSVTFNMYDAEVAASPFWTESQSVTVDEGFFTAYLGDIAGMPANFPSYTEVWLGIAIESDPEMQRFQLGAVPYALEAQTCQQVGDLTETDITNNFLPSDYTPSWNDLTDVPAGFADGTDDGFTTEGELTTLLDDNYLPSSYVPSWEDLVDMPSGFADDVDDVGFTTEAELTALLDDNYDATPPGTLQMYAGSAAPAGYLLCDGSAVSRATYADLFAVVGETYGAGDGTTTFNLPDMRQRFPLGLATSGTGSTLGEAGGAIDHQHSTTLAVGNLPAHDHTYSTSTSTDGAHSHSSGLSTNTTGNHVHQVDTSGSYQIQWCAQCLPYFCAASTGCAQFRLNPAPAPSTWLGDHSHSVSGSIDGVDDHGHSVSGTTATTGSGTAVSSDSVNPSYVTVNFIIKT